MADQVRVAFDVSNQLGEGPAWLASHAVLAWCDILSGTVFFGQADGSIVKTFQFDEPVSAVFATDRHEVLVATASGLTVLDPQTDARQHILDIERDNPATRSNDARAAPGGEIWFGTMAREPAPGAGSLYRIAGGEVSVVREGITVPNATCFSPDGSTAYFADTSEHMIERCALAPGTARPAGDWQLFVDLRPDSIRPDGAVVDMEGFVWVALVGAGKVARYAPDGSLERTIDMPATRVTCPAFGGRDMTTLYVTSATDRLDEEQRQQQPHAGAVFAIETGIKGQPEHIVKSWWQV